MVVYIKTQSALVGIKSVSPCSSFHFIFGSETGNGGEKRGAGIKDWLEPDSNSYPPHEQHSSTHQFNSETNDTQMATSREMHTVKTEVQLLPSIFRYNQICLYKIELT